MKLTRALALTAPAALLAAGFVVSAQQTVTPVHYVKTQQAPVMDHGVSVDGKPLASPAATAHVTLAGQTITVKYNAPSVRGRTIFGGLVPYGQVWRTGANPATTLITPVALHIGNLLVPAGTYTVYTLPSADKWMLIINKQTGQWGTVYKPEQDLGRVEMKGKTLPSAQEVMSISFDDIKGASAEMHVRWASTDEMVKVSTP